jgi:cytochrome P450
MVAAASLLSAGLASLALLLLARLCMRRKRAAAAAAAAALRPGDAAYGQLDYSAVHGDRPVASARATRALHARLKGEAADWDRFEDVRERALCELAARNGRTYLLHCRGHVAAAIGTDRVLATSDPALVKEIFLKKAHTVRRPARYLMAQHLPGLDGVLFQDGPKWERHSRTLKPVFHGRNFSQFTAGMAAAARAHVADWARGDLVQHGWDCALPSSSSSSSCTTSDGRGDGGQQIDVLKSLRVLATTIALGVGYGLEADSEHGRALRTALDGYDEKARFRSAGKNPCLLIGALIRVWLDARKIRGAVAAIVGGVKTATATSTTAGTTATPALPKLSWIRQMVEAEFSIQDISNEVGHLHAAHKAIAFLTSFALYRLGKGPSGHSWQKRMRDEFESVLGAGVAPTKEDLPNLRVCMSVWKETLRMHPISLGVMRETGSDIEVSNLPDGKGPATIPAGTCVQVLLYALHHDPEFWELPHTFNPDRWIESDNVSAKSTFSARKGVREAFVPFLDGKRQCEGRFLAELEFTVFMYELLREHRVEVPDAFTLRIGPDFFPDPEEPIPVVLKRW